MLELGFLGGLGLDIVVDDAEPVGGVHIRGGGWECLGALQQRLPDVC